MFMTTLRFLRFCKLRPLLTWEHALCSLHRASSSFSCQLRRLQESEFPFLNWKPQPPCFSSFSRLRKFKTVFFLQKTTVTYNRHIDVDKIKDYKNLESIPSFFLCVHWETQRTEWESRRLRPHWGSRSQWGDQGCLQSDWGQTQLTPGRKYIFHSM